MIDLQSDMAAATLRLTYNSAITLSVDVRAVIDGKGFAVVPAQSFQVERLGDRITVPPNGNT